jgi:uncharacterized coiled-coil protein SlyX
MERVGVLINKLKEQYDQKASIQNMMVTAQMLQTELLQQSSFAVNSDSKVAVVAPNVSAVPAQPLVVEHETYKPIVKPEPEPEPIPEPMPEPQVPAVEPEPTPTPKPEPEPIPHFLEGRRWEEIFNTANDTKRWHADPVMEVPTLAHQEKIIYELNDVMATEHHSLNDKLNEQKAEMVSMLQETPIKDLKRAISINDRHRFINELFRGDETMYERSIKTINSFNIFAEAEYWIQRELKVKLGWNNTLDLVKTFDQLVRRCFS